MMRLSSIFRFDNGLAVLSPLQDAIKKSDTKEDQFIFNWLNGNEKFTVPRDELQNTECLEPSMCNFITQDELLKLENGDGLYVLVSGSLHYATFKNWGALHLDAMILLYDDVEYNTLVATNRMISHAHNMSSIHQTNVDKCNTCDAIETK